MSAGIKLYKHFTDQLGQMGKVKRAWFTTFNFDISFFEKYMLSALQGVSYETIQSPMDYEALSINLSNDEQDEVEDGKLEVKIFYDPRALSSSGKQKQTALELYPIDVKSIKSTENNLDFSNGVFHPKVILIETVSGEYWLMTSSANLTFGGWSKNRESFFFEKITDTKVARELGIFFTSLTKPYKELNTHPLLRKLNNGKMSGEVSNWTFHSSFSKKNFCDRLTESANEIIIWSPYFADNLSELIDELMEGSLENMVIIPAKNELQKIRITESSFLSCSKKEGVIFKQDKLPAEAINSFVHAKLWLTPQTVAIGSWNMTHAGMNIGNKGNNNIEAGIFYNLSKREYQQILSNHIITPLKSPLHYKQNELEEEKSELLESFEVVVDIMIDWNTLQLDLITPSYSKLLKNVSDQDIICLPGLGEQKIKILESSFSIREYSNYFLTDRYFEIKTRQGKTIYKGFIREKGLAQRPAIEFKTIDDFLKGWLNESPEERQELHQPAFNIEDQFGDQITSATKTILTSSHQNDWFMGFQAFESILNRINNTKSKPSKDKKAELIKVGRVLPGNLNELRKHLTQLKDLYDKERKEFRKIKSPIYLWFLIEKANYVFNQYNETINIPVEHIKKIHNIPFQGLFKKEEIDKLGIENIDKWKSYILNKLKQ